MKNKCFAITAVCVLSVMLLSSGVYANPKTAAGATATDSGSGGGSAAGQTQVGGDSGSAGNCTGVCADTKTKLLGIGSGKDKWTTEAAKEVGNTLRMLTDEEKAELEAAREYERIQRKVEREEAKAKEKQDKIARQYQQCLEKTQSSFGTNSFGDATEKAKQMCRAQQYKALMDAGLTDVAAELGVTPKDVRTAQETQAAMEYAQCIKTHNEAYCQKQLNQAYEKAKEEYFAADPSAATSELSAEKEKCLSQTSGGNSDEIAAYCKMKYKESLNNYGLTQEAENTSMSPEEMREAKGVQAEMNYEECIRKTRSETQCTKQYKAELKTAEMDYLKENSQAARQYADEEYNKCTAENPGSRGQIYCASKNKEILNEVGLTNEADSILNDPADKRIAKEVQAEKDYNACIQARKSDTSCKKEYASAKQDAQLEYYRTAEPNQARAEIDRTYWSCVGNGENIPTVRAKCSQQRDTTLRQAGLDTSVPVSQKPGTEQATGPKIILDYTGRMPGEYEIDRRVNEYMDQTLSGGGTIPSENSETNSSELSDPADDIYRSIGWLGSEQTPNDNRMTGMQ